MNKFLVGAIALSSFLAANTSIATTTRIGETHDSSGSSAILAQVAPSLLAIDRFR
jgi:hypothetical protein